MEEHTLMLAIVDRGNAKHGVMRPVKFFTAIHVAKIMDILQELDIIGDAVEALLRTYGVRILLQIHRPDPLLINL
jgi:hypothetical protein